MEAIERRISFTSSAVELEHLGGRGISTLVPRRFLFGTQPKDQYSDRRGRSVDRLLGEQGFGFLERSPIIPCMLDGGSNSTLIAIIQGHHRTRESGRYRFSQMPSKLLVVEELTDVLNARLESEGQQSWITPQDVNYQLTHDIAVTLDSFSSCSRTVATPVEIPGRWSRAQLVEMFAQTAGFAA